MAAPIRTGVEAVDAELARRAPFSSPEEEEDLAARLIEAWRACQPKSTRPGGLASTMLRGLAAEPIGSRWYKVDLPEAAAGSSDER